MNDRITPSQAVKVNGIRRDAKDGGAWTLLDVMGNEVAPRQATALTSREVFERIEAAKLEGEAQAKALAKSWKEAEREHRSH